MPEQEARASPGSVIVMGALAHEDRLVAAVRALGHWVRMGSTGVEHDFGPKSRPGDRTWMRNRRLAWAENFARGRGIEWDAVRDCFDSGKKPLDHQKRDLARICAALDTATENMGGADAE